MAATLQPGASVSVIARQFDVNANQVFSWRRQYRKLIARPSPDVSKPGLVAVTITPDPPPEAAAAPPPTPGISDAIEIEVCGTYRVLVRSNFDCRAAGWAMIASLLETCKLNRVDPLAWTTDVLVNRWPASRIDDLMPWAYAISK